MFLILLLVQITVCMSTNRVLSAKPCSKNEEETTLFFELWLMSEEFQHPTIQTKIVQSFGRFFHQIKMHRPIGRKDSIQTVIPTCRRLDSFLYEAAENFEVISKFHN